MNRKTIITLRVIFAVAAVCCIAVGIANDEFREVMQKAIRVCLECIGIG